MLTLILVIIYISFINLGLSESLLGAAWPIMQINLSLPVSAAGAVSMCICGGTIISSLISSKLTHRFGTGKIIALSVALTSAALFGFSFSTSIIWLCIAAFPLGLGVGSVDAALNNFVAIYYKAKHMNWLHCFWGIGASASPVLMAISIQKNGNWQNSYLTVAVLRVCLTLILFISLPMWKKIEALDYSAEQIECPVSNTVALKTPGVMLSLFTLICYQTVEVSTALWCSSYFVSIGGYSEADASRWMSLFYGGMTIGRFFSGLLTTKISKQVLIRLGQILCIIGTVLLMLPLPRMFSIIGLFFIGLGCAPIFPCILHETPSRFGEKASRSIMGLQMAFAFMGSTFLPPIFGLIASAKGIAIFPYFLLFFILAMLLSSEKINKFFH